MKKKTFQSILQSRTVIVAEIIIVIVLGVSIVQEVVNKHEISTEVTRLEQQLEILENQNIQLAQVLKEMLSDNFLEKEARKKLDVQKPGETVVLIPQKSNEGTEVIVETTLNSGQEVIRESNTSKWWKYFFS